VIQVKRAPKMLNSLLSAGFSVTFKVSVAIFRSRRIFN